MILNACPSPPAWVVFLLLAALVVQLIANGLHRRRVLRHRARAAWLRTEHALRISGRPARVIPQHLALESDGRGSL